MSIQFQSGSDFTSLHFVIQIFDNSIDFWGETEDILIRVDNREIPYDPIDLTGITKEPFFVNYELIGSFL